MKKYGNRRTDTKQAQKTRQELINQEQPSFDSVSYSYDPDAPKSSLNKNVMLQYDQAIETRQQSSKLRNYKKRQIGEYTSNFSINQVAPSPIVTVINVVLTTLLTLILIISFFFVFGVIFGFKVSTVPADNMEPEIKQGSMLIIKPMDRISQLRVGDVLCYVKESEDSSESSEQTGSGYVDCVNRVKDIAGGIITMVSDNDMYDTKDYINFKSVTGLVIMAIPYGGYVLNFVKENLIIVASSLAALIVVLLLVKILIERRRMKEQIVEFVGQKREFEQRMTRESLEQQKINEERELEDILSK